MQAENWVVIQEFLRKADPKNKDVQKAFGLSERTMEIFWAALSTLSEETGLAIPDFAKVAKKVVNSPSSYINMIKESGAIERGGKRGKWNIAEKAIDKMRKLLDGEAAVSDELPVVMVKLSPKKARKTAGQVIKKLEAEEKELQLQEEDLRRRTSEILAKRKTLQQKIKTIVEAFQ